MRKAYLIYLIATGTLLQEACSEPSKPRAVQNAVRVGVVTAKSEAVAAIVEAPGSVQPRNRVVLSAQINGFVREVTVHAGDAVSAGRALVTLDARDAESQKAAALASIEEAQTALAEARKGAAMAQNVRMAAKASADLASGTYLRYQKLFESSSVSPQELDEVRARRDAAVADLAAKEDMVAAAADRLRQIDAKIAQANAQSRRTDVYVGWTVIKAPMSGRIAERNVDPGSAVFPGSPLITLESSSGPQVVASLPTTDLPLLRKGMEVKVRIPEGPQSVVPGRVSEIIPLSIAGSHTVQFKVDLPSGFDAVPGTFAKVEIAAGTRQALLVPVGAVRESGQLSGVFIADSSATASFRLVKATPYDPENMELLAGVEPGERVIAKLTDQITDGVSLEIRQ
jgi:multidrug resistance efflux pump